MKRSIAVFILVVLWLAVYSAGGQTVSSSAKARQENLKKHVGSLSRAFAADDYEKLADLFFIPRDFADADEQPREKIISVVKQMIEQTKIDGMQFTVQIKSTRNIVAAGDELFAVVPQKTKIVVAKNSKVKDGKGQTIPGGQYEASGYVVAISKDAGETWQFWNEVSKENLEREFPAASGKIKLPAIQKPYFLR